MQKFEFPNIEIKKFAGENVVTASGDFTPGNNETPLIPGNKPVNAVSPYAE